MENGFLNEFTPAESIKQVRQYFDVIESSVSVGDTNRKYVPNKITASPGGTQKEGSFLTFNISPVGENICDLYNSTINATMNVKVKPSETISQLPTFLNDYANAPAVGIGFQDSAFSISAYQIFANGRQIYSQDSPHEEFFITSCGATEAIKTVDIFSKARHKDIWKRIDTIKSFGIIDLNNVAANTVKTVEIPIKIDVRRFLPLDSVRYLPAFAGNVQIKVKFSSEALVITPLSHEDLLGHNKFLETKLANYPPITNKFVPFENQFTMVKTVTCKQSNGTDAATTLANTASITLTTATQQFTKSERADITLAYSYLQCFSLDANTYSELVEHYSQTALMFPIKRMDWQTMEGSFPESNPSGKQTVFTASYTPIYVNSIFILFKKAANYFTVYENPLFETYQLNCGAYGNIPAEPESSYGPIFYETCANALNTNNDLCGFNSDVMRSLTATSIEETGLKSNDTTHFFMGFPTETDFTFQQGMTSNSPISFKLTVKNTTGTTGYTEKPQIGFLRHCCLSIQVAPNGPPAVQIDDYDLSAPSE